MDEADKTKWTFHLRKGVKFHDGSDFDADAVLWNFDRLFDKDSPQYSARMASLVNFRIPSLAYDPDTNAKGWKKIDSHTVEFTTKSPDSFFPYQVCYILMSSPARFAEAGDWNKFAENPSGTGPWQLVELVPRERAEFVPFADHWDETRQPQLDKVITIPLPDPNARTAALLAGQVDWVVPRPRRRCSRSGTSGSTSRTRCRFAEEVCRRAEPRLTPARHRALAPPHGALHPRRVTVPRRAIDRGRRRRRRAPVRASRARRGPRALRAAPGRGR